MRHILSILFLAAIAFFVASFTMERAVHLMDRRVDGRDSLIDSEVAANRAEILADSSHVKAVFVDFGSDHSPSAGTSRWMRASDAGSGVCNTAADDIAASLHRYAVTSFDRLNVFPRVHPFRFPLLI